MTKFKMSMRRNPKEKYWESFEYNTLNPFYVAITEMFDKFKDERIEVVFERVKEDEDQTRN